jgi:hypothetical protein
MNTSLVLFSVWASATDPCSLQGSTYILEPPPPQGKEGTVTNVIWGGKIRKGIRKKLGKCEGKGRKAKAKGEIYVKKGCNACKKGINKAKRVCED